VGVVVTGGNGFIGRNLRLRLGELGYQDVVSVTRETDDEARRAALSTADFVFHLAGVNRPEDPREFEEGNSGFTRTVCEELLAAGRSAPIVFTSSSQAVQDNPYGRSKRASEEALDGYAAKSGAAVAILRLWNVFGKWARPDYNSVVATFCHNVARGLPIHVRDAGAIVRLVHVDDVVRAMVTLLESGIAETGLMEVGPVQEITLGDLAASIRSFADSRRTLAPGRVGTGLTRALYSTYVSYLPPESFAYTLAAHEDVRGTFGEMLRTPDAGQFSFFTAHPGVTRGGHYHHSKTEKFLVVQGVARFGFRQVDTGERHVVVVRGEDHKVVETVPGWAHDVTNVGDVELIVMLWANEVFDPNRPDTVAVEVDA
jgi:UDP-2-acetamido-2,6-beta-L-arabino-hexul-4-ose reductase